MSRGATADLDASAAGAASQPFLARLDRAFARNDSLLCIGLDPQLEMLPTSLRHLPPGQAVLDFNRRIIDATADLVCCYKPNLAFYEALGPEGLGALRETVRHIPDGVLALGDAKRGDIDNTMRLYGRALFDVYGFDCVTASPYLGRDALEPLLERADRGIFLLCRTSNAGATEIAELPVNGRPLFLTIAERVQAWNQHANAGLIVGATYPRELAQVRAVAPQLPILLPGVGAQQGALEESVASGIDSQRKGLLVAAARQVLYASSGDDYPAAARQTAMRLRDAINRVRLAA